MTKNEKLQSIIRLYMQVSGEKAVDMEKVAIFAMSRGAIAPKPKTATELLAAELSHAASQEHRKDPVTGWSYRALHALRKTTSDGKQLTLWVDIDEATRHQMHTSLTNRRQQMIGDGVQLKIDESRWNSQHLDEQPIQMIMDFTDDVDERLHSPDMEQKAA